MSLNETLCILTKAISDGIFDAFRRIMENYEIDGIRPKTKKNEQPKEENPPTQSNESKKKIDTRLMAC